MFPVFFMLIYNTVSTYVWLGSYFLNLVASVFSVTQFIIIIPFHSNPEVSIEKRPVLEPDWTLCAKASLLHCHPPKCGRPESDWAGTSALCPAGQTGEAVAQSGDRSWQLAGSEAFGGLTGQEQKQKRVELIATCPEIHAKVKWQVKTWCDLQVARNRRSRRENIQEASLDRQNASTVNNILSSLGSKVAAFMPDCGGPELTYVKD